MLDMVIRGGDIIDGTGAPRTRGDLGIRDGRIVAVGVVDDKAEQTVDADGLVVAPGFVDIHTHYDAQALWDPDLSPSCFHGVTTVIGGNCGFSIAPLGDEADAGFMSELLGVVEAIPPESLRAGADWSWRTFGDYATRLEGHLGVNAGFLVGHSAIRRTVMGERSLEESTDDDLGAMQDLLAHSLAEGGLGFSSSWGAAHAGAPSLAAHQRELVSLADVTGHHAGTTLSFLPSIEYRFDDSTATTMIEMSRAADRSINWNLLFVRPGITDADIAARLAVSDRAREEGAAVFALLLPIPMVQRVNFATGFLLRTVAVFDELFDLAPDARVQALRDPDWRQRLAAAAAADGRPFARFATLEVVQVGDPRFAALVGRRMADIAAERATTPAEATFDLTADDALATVFVPPSGGDDRETWGRRGALFADRRVLIGGSDAGAHLDLLTTYGFFTDFVGRIVRDLHLLPLEQAVRLVTNRPARLYGLTGRGRLALGWSADVVVFDPGTVATMEPQLVADFPGRTSRLVSGAAGIEHVIVNGREVVRAGTLTGARSGRFLRSGRDTETVTSADALAQT